MSDPSKSGNSLTDFVARWERLLAGAEANKDDMPALERWRTQLEAAASDVKAACQRRDQLEAEAREATRELRTLFGLGRDLASRFQSGVRLLYGRRSPKLREFGMKPLLRTRKKAVPRCTVQGCPLEASATAK